MGAIELFQDVVILTVTVEEADVHIDVYGGGDNVCATVRFTFADPEVHRDSVDRLRRWREHGVPLSLVVQADEVRLLNERALFRRALESAGAE